MDSTFRSFLTTDLLILDDLGLHGLTGRQFSDLYELNASRHRVSRFVITINRAVEERLSLVHDSVLGNRPLDRVANARYQNVIEGQGYRDWLSPQRALLDKVTRIMVKGGDRPGRHNLTFIPIATPQGCSKSR